MKKFIFLDVDGVVATKFEDRSAELYTDGNYGFEAFALRNLEMICDAHPDAQIVISSTWRMGKNIKQLQEIFRERGFKYPERIIDKTMRGLYYNRALSTADPGNIQTCPRGLEIKAWLYENVEWGESHAYVILDDDGDMMLWQRYNFVQTKTFKGLTKLLAKKAIEILKYDADPFYRNKGKPPKEKV